MGVDALLACEDLQGFRSVLVWRGEGSGGVEVRRAIGSMGLEFKPYWTWEDEEHDHHVSKCGDEKQTTSATTTTSTPADSAQSNVFNSLSGQVVASHGSSEVEAGRGGDVGLVFVHAEGSGAGTVNRDLAASLAAMNAEHREYAVLVASEEDNVNEYKSFFAIVLDCPQFLGQGETNDSALRQASRFLHYAFGSAILENEMIPAPSSGVELEAKKIAMERDWLMVKLENFSMELVSLQFQPGIDYMARPPESDGEYESDHEDEELFELESRMSTP